MTVRPLTPPDVAQALDLSAEAGWNQTANDWQRVIALEPDHCLTIEDSGAVAATATLLRYGVELGWVGMVLTRSTHRRRGLARRLLERLVPAGVRTLKLDATEEGRPLYESLGFVDEQPIERWRRDPAACEPGEASRGRAHQPLDTEAFGVDRARLLESLGDAFVVPGGHAFERPGTRARYFGPCVARDLETAGRLARAAIAGHPAEPWFWDILPANKGAIALACDLGFTPVRSLARMRRGPPSSGNDRLVYAIAGFEFG